MRKLIVMVLIVGFFGLFMTLGLGYAYAWNDYNQKREQPIAFNHKIHVGQLGVKCTECHTTVEKSRQAGVPALQKCASCHKTVTIKNVAVIERDYEEGRTSEEQLDAELLKVTNLKVVKQYVTAQKPIPWARVHALPNHAYFTHQPHIKAGLDCVQCHGHLEQMGIARQVTSLTMGWCVACHTTKNAALDCWTCHK